MVVCLVREFSPKWPSIKLSCPDTYMILYIAQIHVKIHFLGIISQVALDFGNN